MLKIPVCYSFDAPVLTEFIGGDYVLAGCGGYSSGCMQCLDSSGENISAYNKYVNELTLIYWAAKNYEKLGNPDYIGFAHYRRYLKFDRAKLAENRIFCAFEDQPFPLYRTYCLYHVKSDIDAFAASFIGKFPSMKEDFEAYMAQRRHAKCNMFVAPKALFFDYFSLIEPCIRICLDEMLPKLGLDSRDRYQSRALGFILERMTGFWVYLKQKDPSVEVVGCECVEEKIRSIYSRLS